ncbi:tetratricopeptide repeat protein [Oligoflexus tunisiensis]|uniref:tetratricopeptide repeat protein n=1 Tax=Oligoflexus tunisiensis TaxID=708132 RepID=UPI001C406E24|nr:hypothetical protein [Oligoflexus tunisiensis]
MEAAYLVATEKGTEVNTENRKWISLVAGVMAGGLVIVLGKALFDKGEPSVSIHQNPVTAGSTAREADLVKRKKPQNVDLSALTQPFDYKPAEKDKTACAMEYDRLALLSSEELMRSIMRQEAQISDACQQALQTGSGRGGTNLEEIRAACQAGIHASSCLTPIIGLKTQLIDIGTEYVDAQDLPANVLLSKLYARSGKNDKTAADILSILALLDELESRDAPAGLENLRLSLLTDLAYMDITYLDEFEALAETTELENPEDALAYRFKYHMHRDEVEKIENLVKEHLQNYPQSAQAHYYLAIAAHEKGDMNLALALASKSLELNPSDTFVQEQVQILRENPSEWKRPFRLPNVIYTFGD